MVREVGKGTRLKRDTDPDKVWINRTGYTTGSERCKNSR